MATVISIRDYLRVLFRRKYAFLVPVALSIVAAGPVWVLTPPKFRAQALIKRQDLGVMRRAGVAEGSGGGASLQTLREEILTVNNLRRVITQLKMDLDLKTPDDWQKKFADLRRDITIRQTARAGGVEIIEIAAVSSRQSLASQIANTVADNYLEEAKRNIRYGPERAVDFLKKRVEDTQGRLRSKEIEISQYKQQHIEDLPAVAESLSKQVFDLDIRKKAQEHLLQSAQRRLEEMDKQLTETPQTIVGEAVNEENPEYAELRRTLAALKRQLDAMTGPGPGKRTLEHPEVIILQNDIARTEKQLAETPPTRKSAEREILNTAYQKLLQDRQVTRQEIVGYQAAIERIAADIRSKQDQVKSVVQREKTYDDLLRERDILEKDYEQFANSLRSAEIQYDIETSQAGVQVDMIQRAETAENYRADRMKYALACIGAGICAGLGFLFAFEFCDHSLRGRDDAAAFLAVPVLGCISIIVSPAEAARARRRRWIVLAVVAGAFVLCVAALLIWNYQSPDTLRRIYRAIRLSFA